MVEVIFWDFGGWVKRNLAASLQVSWSSLKPPCYEKLKPHGELLEDGAPFEEKEVNEHQGW